MIRALIPFLIAIPALAETFKVPQGCTPLASVQHRSCEVSLYWSCAGEPGYATATANADGITWLTARDEGGQWTQMTHVPSGMGLMLGQSPDPSDHRSLLETGSDTYSYAMETRDQSGTWFYQGENRVVAETSIGTDPVTEISYDFVTRQGGSAETRVRGRAYLFGPNRLSITASQAVGEGGAARNVEPVEILTEGEPGFMDMTPRYDCGEQIS